MQLGRRAVVDRNGGLGRDTQPVVHCVSYQTTYAGYTSRIGKCK
jgi:hypothetical protein